MCGTSSREPRGKWCGVSASPNALRRCTGRSRSLLQGVRWEACRRDRLSRPPRVLLLRPGHLLVWRHGHPPAGPLTPQAAHRGRMTAEWT